MLNINGSLTKMGVEYSTLWSVDFTDEFFLTGLRQWLKEGKVTHRLDHVRSLDPQKLPEAEKALGEALAEEMQVNKVIMGIFDEAAWVCITPSLMMNTSIHWEFIRNG